MSASPHQGFLRDDTTGALIVAGGSLTWADCTLTGGVIITAGFQSSLQAAIDGQGFVHMRGVVTINGGTASGVTAFTLPVACRPLTKRLVGVNGSANSAFQAAFATDGTVAPGTTAWPNGQIFGFDGVKFSV